MENRFKVAPKRDLQLTILGVVWANNQDLMSVKFKLRNIGDVEAHRPRVSIRLPEEVTGEVPKREKPEYESAGYGLMYEVPDFDMWGMWEERGDFFEENGRVGMIDAVGGMHQVLLTGHSTTFKGLGIPLSRFGAGSTLKLDYRIDAQGFVPVTGALELQLPSKPEDLLSDDE
jgi:hypothetical protein